MTGFAEMFHHEYDINHDRQAAIAPQGASESPHIKRKSAEVDQVAISYWAGFFEPLTERPIVERASDC